MKTAFFIIDVKLQPLLKPDLRGRPVEVLFHGPQSVKHLIESLRIPHTEIGTLTANGDNIRMDYIVNDGDRLQVQAVTAITSEEEPRFVLDGHLGRLASHLRMLGLDCLYNNAYEDNELVHISVNQERILLTRDRLLLMHKVISLGYLVRSLKATEQLYEVVNRYGLTRWVKPFQRCLRCNHPLKPIKKEIILDKLEPLTKKYFHDFKVCPGCNQVYWKGSHYERMMDLITEISQPKQETNMFRKRSSGGQTEVMKGIHLKTLVHGNSTLMTEVLLEKGAVIPTHSHPHEQTGYLVSGHLQFEVDGELISAHPGDSWNIAGDMKHSATAIEETIVIEVFSPVREDYLPYYIPDE